MSWLAHRRKWAYFGNRELIVVELIMDEFSSRIAGELFEDFPEWRLFSREGQDGEGRFLVVEVPAPDEADTLHGLRVTTNDHEVTVTFDFYHSHFGNWRPIVQDEEDGSAIGFVRSILNESVAVASWWKDERCLGSCQVINGELSEMFPEFTRCRVRSWRGLYNHLSTIHRFSGTQEAV